MAIFNQQLRWKMKMTALLVSILALSSIAQAKKVCNPDEAREAETTSASLKTWKDIYEAYKKHSHCDDGAIAEGYSESVSQMLANQWDKIHDLDVLTKKDSKFTAFVVRHVNQTIGQEEAGKILENVQKHCPSENIVFCKKIEAALKLK